MAKACSLDLREKVMEYIKEGKRKMEAAKVFRLNRKTIYRWGKKQKEGRLAVTKRKAYKPQKLDPEALRNTSRTIRIRH
jgi:transposase